MTTLILFAVLCGAGIFAALCTFAPEWDDERQAPVEAVDAAAERA